MSLSEMLRDSNKSRPMTVTLYGPPGVGKTTAACTWFPKPIVIAVEDGLASLGDNQPAATPLIQRFEQIEEFIKALGNEDHQYKTLVIDSVTRAARMCETELCQREGKGINAVMGGYGAGRNWVSEQLQNMALLCQKLSAYKNMNVVFIGHEGVETITPPDSDPYDRYTLRCHKSYADPFINDCDLVGHLRVQTTVYGADGKKRVRSDGSRTLQLTAHPSTVSKNRFGIKEDVQLTEDQNPLASLLTLEK